MDENWVMKLAKRFAEAAGVENLSVYNVEHKWTLQAELKEKNERLYNALNPFLCYLETLDEKRKDIASWKGDMVGYKADVDAAERDAQREYGKMIDFCSKNNIDIGDLFTELEVDKLKFKLGNLVYWKGSADVFNVFATRFHPEDGRYPADGFDYLIGNVYKNQDERYSVNEGDLSPH